MASPDRRRRSRRSRRRRGPGRHLDLRAAGAVAAWAIGIASAGVVVWAIQAERGRPALLAAAEKLARVEPRRFDLAIRYVDAYLSFRPDDVRGLGLKAEILAAASPGPAGLRSAIEAGERSRRVGGAGPEDLRRLLQCYLQLRRSGASEPHEEKAALRLVAGLDFRGDDSPSDHRLAAFALAEMAPRGDVESVAAAIGHFRRALEADPGDVEAAEALAGLLEGRGGDPAGASAVLDALLRAKPSAEVRLARFRHAIHADPEDRSGVADAELAAALELEPRGLETRLAAASEAIRRGRAEAARRHLDAIGRGDQDDERVWRARGMAGLLEGRGDEAVEDWRRGLVRLGGDDPDLTWRLAFVLLNLGRVRDASPLIARVDALRGGSEAAYPLLLATRELKQGRPSAAIDPLVALEFKAPPELAPMVAYSLGQAFEATGDAASARSAFSRACRALPRDAACRLALVRTLRGLQPGDADDELRRGLAATPENPALRVALARSELAAQARRPRSSRDWRGFEDAMTKARKVAPAAGSAALVEADFLALIGREDRATSRLAAGSRIDRRSPEVRAALGRALAIRGELDEAMLALERGAAPEAAGDRPAIRSARAEILALRGRWDEARAALLDDLDRLPPPDRPPAWAAWGDLLDVRGDSAGASAAYREWARLIPEDPGPRLFLLNRAIEDGGPGSDLAAREALDALESVAAARGHFAKVGRALELLREPPRPEPPLDRAGRLGLAEGAIGEARRLAPASRWIPLLEGRLHETLGRWDEAVSTYESALDRDPDGSIARRLTAILGRWRDDRPLERLAAARPDLAGPLRRRSALEALARGELDRARTTADRVVAADPEDFEARTWRVRLLKLLGRPEEAEIALAALADARPEDPDAALALIAELARLGRVEAARAEAADRASRVVVDRPLLFSARARLLAGDRDAAVIEFEEAACLWPDDPEVAREAADAFLAAGREGLAEISLRRALETSPRPRWAARMLALIFAAREPADRIAHDLALAAIGPASEDDGPEDRVARDLILARVGDEPGRREAADHADRGLADLPTIARDRIRLGADRFADARALARSEGDRRGDRLRFARGVLEAEVARGGVDPLRVVEVAILHESAAREPIEGGGPFLDRIAEEFSGGRPGSARFLDARGVLLAGLGRLDEAADDLRRAAEAGRGRAIGPTALFHLAEVLARLGRPGEARDALDRARRGGLSPGSLGPGGEAELDGLGVALGQRGGG